MNKLEYAASIADNGEGGFIASFDDVPEALHEGASKAEALAGARDALATALLGRLKDGTDLPKPSPARGRPLVVPPAEDAAKIAVIARWLEAGIRKSELAARIGRDEKEVRRILDPEHRTKLGLIEEALAALGAEIVIDLRELDRNPGARRNWRIKRKTGPSALSDFTPPGIAKPKRKRHARAGADRGSLAKRA